MTDSVVTTVPVTRIVIREKRRPWGWLLLFISVGLGMWLLPTTFGGTATLIQVNGQSMEPSYSTGDLVGLRATGDYRTGDVVGYKVPPGQAGEGLVVVHRIIGFDADGHLILKGDNNEFIDSWVIAEADVLGEKEFVVAGFGRVFGSMWALAALLAIFAARIIYVATAAPSERIVRRVNPLRPSMADTTRQRFASRREPDCALSLPTGRPGRKGGGNASEERGHTAVEPSPSSFDLDHL